MNRRNIVSTLALLAAGLAQAQPLTNSFTYQGRLDDGGIPANNTYDFQFKLFNASAGGAQQGGTITRSDVAISQGLITQVLDFGAQYNGQRRWIQVEVRAGSSVGAYTILPRQELTVSPNAAYAMTAGSIASHSLNDAYDDGSTITADAGAVTINGAGGLASTGPVVSGSTAATGNFRLLAGTTGNLIAEARIHGALGGAFEGYEENGTTRTFYLEPDAAGTGGFFNVAGPAGGLTLDGNSGGGARMTILGPDSDFTFDTNIAGNGSAVLPAGAISALEMFDEPGVANAADNSVGTTLSTTSSFTTVLSRSITVPAAGYVLVFGTLETLHTHSSGTETNLQFGVSDSATSQPATQDMGCRIPSSWASGTVLLTNNSHSVFQVAAAGTYTYRILARMNSGSGQTFDTELTCLYVPTAYGAVELQAPRGPGIAPEQIRHAVPSARPFGLTAGDVEAERQSELARHLSQMAAEQQKMQAEIDRLRAELAEGNVVPSVRK